MTIDKLDLLFQDFSPEFVSDILDGKCKYIENGCKEFTGSLLKKGYGVITINKKLYYTHRLAYYIKNGKIPFGKMICHTCNNRKCMNTLHLYAGSSLDNSRDKTLKNLKSSIRIHCEIPIEFHREIFKKCSELDITLNDYLKSLVMVDLSLQPGINRYK